MSAALLTASLLAAAVVAAWVRLGSWWATAAVRSRPWRLALLLGGQPILAALTYLALFPLAMPSARQETLAVLTRGASPTTGAVALPEAAASASGETAPDLGTALRRHPGTGRLRVIGEGLEARDRDAARGLDIAYDPPPLPRGIVALAPPQDAVAPGAGFQVGGQASGVAGGSAALLDPAGVEIDRVPIDADGGFVLAGAARVAGVALFRARLRDARGAIVEAAAVPLWVAPAPAVRVLFLAGAPGPEVKYWRRWAADAGLAATVRVALGGGLDLGDPSPPLTAASLARFDLVIVDERRWATLSVAQRDALTAAVRGGLGLLLRVTGPLSPELRRTWAGFGLPLRDAGTSPAHLRGEGLPVLTRRPGLSAASGIVVPSRDRDGAPLAGWHAVGSGRVGVWTLADAFVLVPSGHGARFGAMWAGATAALARARGEFPPAIPRSYEGERTVICRLAGESIAVAPDGKTKLVSDPASPGCAAYWPRRPGWHLLRQRGASRPFYVYPAAALPAARAMERRDRTLETMWTARPSAAGTASGRTQPGPAWPWLLSLLLVAGALWWLERAAVGR